MATPIPMCVAPPGWFCSPVGTSLLCPSNLYCSGGILPPRQCPDGKSAPMGSIYLTDCADSGNVVFAVVVCLILGIGLMLFCIYCVLDWVQSQGPYQVVTYPAKCPPPWPEPSAPSFSYYQEGPAPCHPDPRQYRACPPPLVQPPVRVTVWN